MLEIHGIHKTFFAGTPNEVRSLQGIDLTIEEGSFVIVIGTNGSGKTTLLNAVAGTFVVDRGTIQLAGGDVTGWPEHRRASLIGRVFQNPFSGTAPNLTIAENLALASRRGLRRGLGWAVGPGRRADFRDRIRSLGINLEGRLENPIGTLSGGQRQPGDHHAVDVDAEGPGHLVVVAGGPHGGPQVGLEESVQGQADQRRGDEYQDQHGQVLGRNLPAKEPDIALLSRDQVA